MFGTETALRTAAFFLLTLAGTGAGAREAGKLFKRTERIRKLLIASMRLEQLVRARLPTGLIRERLLAEGILPTEKEFPRRMPEGRLFLEIKETLGHGSGEEQAAQFHLIAQELEGLYKGAREDARKNGRLFLLLGFFGGMLAGLAG